MIVMLSQQLSGINIIAFFATTFFTSAGLRRSSNADAEIDSYKLAIGWGAANAIFSACAYFLVENKEEPSARTETSFNVADGHNKAFSDRNPSLEDRSQDMPKTPEEDEIAELSVNKANTSADPSYVPSANIIEEPNEPKHPPRDPEGGSNASSTRSSICSNEIPPSIDDEERGFYEYESRESRELRGRRFLLLLSLSGGAVTLLITSLCFYINEDSQARLPLIALFIIIFTLFYSLGAGRLQPRLLFLSAALLENLEEARLILTYLIGAIPFLYCAEVFPNEGREVGMSWSTFWNFGGTPPL